MESLDFSIKLKRLGKRKIKAVNIQVDKSPANLKELIEQCVISQVKNFNDKHSDNQWMSFLTQNNVKVLAAEGKVGFGEIENTQLADETQAIKNAIQCFKDGIFMVFIDDNEVKNLDQKINLNNQSEIAFFRMTILTGTYW